MILGTEDNTKEKIPSDAQIEVLFHLIINIKENLFLFFIFSEDYTLQVVKRIRATCTQ